jgi:hypothetical protein
MDVEAITVEVRSQVTEELREKVTNDVIVMLRDQGMDIRDIRSPTMTPSPIGGRKSSCASASGAADNYDGHEATPDPDTVDGLIEPTVCSQVMNPGGYQMEVARGQVFPGQTQLWSELVRENYAVVHIDYVHPEHQHRLLSLCPSPQVRTLGQALYKRVQWKRDQIVVTPNPKSSKPPLPSGSKSHLNDFAIGNEKVKRSASKSASKETDAASKEPKSTTAPVNQLINTKKAKSTTAPANPQPATVKSDSKLEQQKVAKSTRSFKSDPGGSTIWDRANTNFKYGERFLSKTELEKAGPACVALHAWYMKECEEGRNRGACGVFKKEHFLCLAKREYFAMGLEDLFDLFKLDRLDMGVLRVMSL